MVHERREAFVACAQNRCRLKSEILINSNVCIILKYFGWQWKCSVWSPLHEMKNNNSFITTFVFMKRCTRKQINHLGNLLQVRICDAFYPVIDFIEFIIRSAVLRHICGDVSSPHFLSTPNALPRRKFLIETFSRSWMLLFFIILKQSSLSVASDMKFMDKTSK